MKKLTLFAFALLAVFTLSACGGTIDDTPVNEETLSSEESLATLSYLSTGFLTVSDSPTVATLQFLADEDTTVIEDELDTVNVYFDRLKALIDNGVESFGSVTEEPSDNELYEYKLTFTVNEEVYIIYYNLDDVTGEMTGVIVINEVEYEFEVVDNMREYKFEEQEKNEVRENNANNDDANQSQNGNDDDVDNDDEEDTEDDVDTEEEDDTEDDVDTEDDENETKMMLIAHNGEDTIKIMYKTEVEDDETTTKFDMEQTIAGVTTNIALKISIEEDEYKVDIQDGEDSFTFKQETEEDGVVEYKLTYNVDGVSGTVKITESVDENGELVYDYKISEGNRQKDIQRGRPDYDFDDDEEESEEETDDESTEA